MKHKGNIKNKNKKSLDVIKEEETIANFAKTNLSSVLDKPEISEIKDGEEDIDFDVDSHNCTHAKWKI